MLDHLEKGMETYSDRTEEEEEVHNEDWREEEEEDEDDDDDDETGMETYSDRTVEEDEVHNEDWREEEEEDDDDDDDDDDDETGMETYRTEEEEEEEEVHNEDWREEEEEDDDDETGMETYSDRTVEEEEEEVQNEDWREYEDETGMETYSDRTVEEEEEVHNEDWREEEEEASSNQTFNAKDHESIHSWTSTSRGSSDIVVTLTDPSLLDCPICFEPLTVPVFQCDQNGHIACSLCCTMINNICPSCSCTIRSNRCWAIEKVLESSKTPCQNIKYGCNIPVTYNKKNEHEKTCVFSPCSCPHEGCYFVSSTKNLYRHFSDDHLDSATPFMYPDECFPITLKKHDSFLVLLERQSGTLFVLNNRSEVLGNAVTISCIQPSSMEDFKYKLFVSTNESTLMFTSVTKSTPSLQVNGTSTSFLLIPSEFFNSCGQVNIRVSISPK